MSLQLTAASTGDIVLERVKEEEEKKGIKAERTFEHRSAPISDVGSARGKASLIDGRFRRAVSSSLYPAGDNSAS